MFYLAVDCASSDFQTRDPADDIQLRDLICIQISIIMIMKQFCHCLHTTVDITKLVNSYDSMSHNTALFRYEDAVLPV